MEETIGIFQSLVTNKILENISIFFFLNKMDLLVKLLSYHPLSDVFSDFKGGDYTEAATFMMKKFLRQSTNKDRKIFSHFTNATDIKQFRKIIKDLVIASFEALAKRTNKTH